MTPLGAYLWLIGILLLCGLGLPIPEDISLIAAGYFSYKGVLQVHRAAVICLAAVLAGGSLAFFIGRDFCPGVLARPFAQPSFTPPRPRPLRPHLPEYRC